LYRRGRKGTSTILGTLIFVGIMFTAVIPMLLVMRQADTLNEMRKHELEIFDEERESEDLHVYVFPTSASSDDLTLRVENRGNSVVKIVQIWINDSPHPLDNFVVQPTIWIDTPLDYFTADLDTNYFIMVTTERGNIFSEYSGSLYYNSEGDWEDGSFVIFFIISYPEVGFYYIDVRQGSEAGPHVEGSPFSIHKSKWDTAFDYLSVPAAGTYHVKITQSSHVIYNDYVTIYWSEGSRTATVRA